jgi:3-oxoacyl-[acyl-carrier-protein] synthase III
VPAYGARPRGEFFGRLDDKPDMASRYEEEYPGTLAGVMDAAASRAGVRMDEISVVLPHNVNALSWRKLCRRTGFPIDRVLLDNIAVTGHAFCADPFLNYATAAERGLLRPGQPYLIAGAGLGATFSAMVLEH